MTEGPDVRNDIGGAVRESTIVQTGAVYGDVTIGPRRAPVRSSYREQVRRIAPPRLLGRDAELAELAEFCTAPDGPDYRWYRAAAWAGKSALMSWFVLNPPAGVRIVAFFVTARFAGQSDRIAFGDVVLEQLAELLAQPMPAYLTDATRDSHLIGMLDEGALACAGRGERLVLVVDGLDEDRGVTTGPDAHSIAALLPDRPVGGMRVLVAGRPNPPVPADVSDAHPLRDPAIVRPLTASGHAATVRTRAEQELRRLLIGTEEEQDLLGLIAAAGGGLSGPDVAELTGRQLWQVRDHLRAVSGRTFTPRATSWTAANDVYVLAHEELQRAAIAFLGPARLTEYRARLHTWADTYRERNWPGTTPEYLLRGYFRMLTATGDLPRMIAMATSDPRHDRMLDITGGDAHALTEITTTQQALMDLPDPDLPAMARLAVHRGRLVDRNSDIPVTLPAVWAMLGHHIRANALADSITDPDARIEVLSEWASLAARRGDTVTAGEMLDRATDIALRQAPPDQALQLIVETASAMGDIDRVMAVLPLMAVRVMTGVALQRALTVAVACGNITGAVDLAARQDDRSERGHRLGMIVDAVRASGDLDRAVRITELMPPYHHRDRAVARLVGGFAAAGDIARADELLPVILGTAAGDDARAEVIRALARAGRADDAEARVPEIRDPGRRSAALIAIASAVAENGDSARAEAILDPVIGDRRASRLVVTRALCAMAAIVGGDRARALLDRAESVAMSITAASDRVLALSAVIERRPGDALRLADAAMTTVPDISDEYARRSAVRTLFGAMAADDIIDWAAALANSLGEPTMRVAALNELVRTAIAAGATTLPSVLTAREESDAELSTLVRSVAEAGDVDRAESLAVSITDPVNRADTLAKVTSAVAATGDIVRAAAVAARITVPSTCGIALLDVLQRADVAIGEEIARTVIDDRWQSRMLAQVAWVAVAHGDRERGGRLAEEAEKLARLAGGAEWPSIRQLTTVAGAIADDTGRAGALADRAEGAIDPRRRAAGLSEVVVLAAAIGDTDRAGRLLAEMVTAIRDEPAPREFTREHTDAAAAAGDLVLAESFATAAAVPAEKAIRLIVVAMAAARAGESRWAARLADQIIDIAATVRNSYTANEILGSIAPTVVTTGGVERAVALARSVDDLVSRTSAFALLARKLVATGAIEQARALLDEIEPPERRPFASPDSATAMAVGAFAAMVRATGDPAMARRAEELLDTIRDPDERARALAALAPAVPNRARRLVAQAFQIARDWTIPLAALADLDRAVLTGIVDDLLA